MSNISVLVDKRSVLVAIDELQEELSKATKITTESTWTELQEARKSISRAEGMFNVLHGLDIIAGWQIVAEDIERIKLNHDAVSKEKQRDYRMNWRKP